MSASRRVQRVERELREIVSTCVVANYSSLLEGLVTVTRVEASPDLRHAKVFLSMMSGEDEKKENLDLLASEVKNIQHVIAKQLPMKFCPKISFVIDRGFEKAQIIEQKLKEIKREGSED